MPADPVLESDARILALFDSPGEIETPTPGVKAWLAGDLAPDGTPRPVIVKRVREASGMGQRKARATEALHLSHANILRPRRWLADGGYLYVAREVIRGKNLRQALTTVTGEKPGPELLRKLLLPLMDALTYTHGQGVVHGGISPENIIIAEDGRLLLVDFATVDPTAPRHQANYSGSATSAGDVRALGAVMAAYLPNAGAFQNVAVRARIEGLIRRCDTVDDLREILNSLEKLATASVPGGMARPKDGVPFPFSGTDTPHMPTIGIPRLEIPTATAVRPPGPAGGYDLGTEPTGEVESPAAPVPATVTVLERAVRVPQGGGGIVTLKVRNEGPRPLVVRTITTQHAWLNPRPVGLPLIIAVSAAENVELAISAARLTPGEYRSEVYLSLHPAGEFNEMAHSGWDKHTSEIRITVESQTPPMTISSQASVPGNNFQGRPPYPQNAPRVRGGPGCAALSLLALLVPLCLLPLMTQLFMFFRLR